MLKFEFVWKIGGQNGPGVKRWEVHHQISPMHLTHMEFASVTILDCVLCLVEMWESMSRSHEEWNILYIISAHLEQSWWMEVIFQPRSITVTRQRNLSL